MDDLELDECLRALAHYARRQVIRMISGRYPPADNELSLIQGGLAPDRH